MADIQMTTPEYNEKKKNDWAGLKKFYNSWLTQFAPQILECACCYCVPPWLLASVLLGEVTAMDTYFGINEHTLEKWTPLGQSVGLGQITSKTAVKYGLTPESLDFGNLQERLAKAMRPEPTEGDWKLAEKMAYFVVREELLNPLINICASAKYLNRLIKMFRRLGVIKSYLADGSKPWGEFDFTNITSCDMNLDKASNGGTVDERRMRIAKLFGAAHNDDGPGPYTDGVGQTQGENAGNVAQDLIDFGFIKQFKLETCPEDTHNECGADTQEDIPFPPHKHF